MIFLGYPGIGKTSLAEENFFAIDLESSNFCINNSKKMEQWYIPYCKIAESLSAQGYDVFLSTHPAVVRELSHSYEHVVAIYPSMLLKDDWVAKLEQRYKDIATDKNKRALERVRDHFEEDIESLREASINHLEIQHVRYNLSTLIHNYHKRHGDAKEEGVLYDERGVARYQRV